MVHNACEKILSFIQIDVFKEKWWNWKKLKLICDSSPRKKTRPLPLIHQTPSWISTIVQPPPINSFKKHLTTPLPYLKRRGEAHTTKHSVLPRVFFAHMVYIYIYIYIYIYTYIYIYYIYTAYLCGTEAGLIWLGPTITITRSA